MSGYKENIFETQQDIKSELNKQDINLDIENQDIKLETTKEGQIDNDLSDWEKKYSITRLNSILKTLNLQMPSNIRYQGPINWSERYKTNLNNEIFSIEAYIVVNIGEHKPFNLKRKPSFVLREVLKIIKTILSKYEEILIEINSEGVLIIRITNQHLDYDFNFMVKDLRRGLLCQKYFKHRGNRIAWNIDSKF